MGERLAIAGHRPRKRFSQNFLHDRAVAERIVRAIAPRRGQRLLEIGPGEGALTELLLEATGRLDAIEVDRDLAATLDSRLGPRGLALRVGDALKLDLESLGARHHELRVVGNLPYNISTPLLFRLLDQAVLIDDLHFTLQREVVERMAAGPGTASYGRLSVMVQLACRVEKLFDVGAGAFRPAPRVTSSVVRLGILRTPPVELADPAIFKRLVARLFANRRKTVRNGLKGMLEAEAIARVGVEPGLRPEVLDIEAFARLANAIAARDVG